MLDFFESNWDPFEARNVMRPAFAELRESILKDDGSMSKKKNTMKTTQIDSKHLAAGDAQLQ